MEDTIVDNVTDGNVAEIDSDDAEAMAQKTRGDGYIEQDNL